MSCPNCGSNDTFLETLGFSKLPYMTCVSCGFDGPSELTEAEARASWRMEAARTEAVREYQAAQWQPIETLPPSGEYVGYWSYLDQDGNITEDVEMIYRSTDGRIGDHEGTYGIGLYKKWTHKPKGSSDA